MEKLFIPKFKLVPIKFKFRVESYLCIGLTKNVRIKNYFSPNSSYGEWIFTLNQIPRFYFSSISSNGIESSISIFIQKNNLNYELFLIKMLEQSGYKGVKPLRNKTHVFKLKKESDIEELELLELTAISM